MRLPLKKNYRSKVYAHVFCFLNARYTITAQGELQGLQDLPVSQRELDSMLIDLWREKKISRSDLSLLRETLF